jgi:hypothetical protein
MSIEQKMPNYLKNKKSNYNIIATNENNNNNGYQIKIN